RSRAIPVAFPYTTVFRSEDGIDAGVTGAGGAGLGPGAGVVDDAAAAERTQDLVVRYGESTGVLEHGRLADLECARAGPGGIRALDRKSTRLNSSHGSTSY